jgi:hypothetical protein
MLTTNEDIALVVPEEAVEPTCCWCGGKIALAGKFAWCETEACRDKQLACTVAVERDGMQDLLFVPTPRQAEAMMATEPNLFVWGNRGGGKSVCMRWLCHALATAIPGFKYAILRTSFPELMKNHLIYLDDECNRMGGEKEGFKYHKTEHVVYYPNGSIGFYAQCANDADVKKILGAEVCLVVFDEAPTFEWQHMRLIAASIRVPAGSGLIPMTRYLGNPIGESIEELWRYFIDKDVDLNEDPEYRPQDWREIEMRIQDNPHLDAKQYWRQFSGLPAHFIRAWKEGIRIEENTLFEFYPNKDNRPYHVVQEIPRFGDGTPLFTVKPDGTYVFPDWVQVYRAYDHGFWPDPAVCLWFAVYGRRILCFKELTRTRTLAPDMAREIVEESKGMRVVTTYCDPSIDIETGADVHTILQKMEDAGVPMTPSINDREVFADAIHTVLGEEVSPSTPRIQFLESACPMTVKAIPKMKFNENNPAALADHKMDHWPIALAYFGMTQIPETKPSDRRRRKRWQLPKKGRGSASARVLHRVLSR